MEITKAMKNTVKKIIVISDTRDNEGSYNIMARFYFKKRLTHKQLCNFLDYHFSCQGNYGYQSQSVYPEKVRGKSALVCVYGYLNV